MAAALAGTYATHYSRYNGAQALDVDDEPTNPEQPGHPYLVFEIATDQYDEEWACQRLRVMVRAMANDFNGGRVGAENAITSQALLSADLIDYINGAYATLRDAGLLDVRVYGPKQLMGSDADGPVYVYEHQLDLHYQRIGEVTQ
jgi:hypothetical protein